VTKQGSDPASKPAADAEQALADIPAKKAPRVLWTHEKRPARHPSLGLAPVDMTAGFPAGAEKLRTSGPLLAARALEAVAAKDPTLTERHDEMAMRRLLRDGELVVERLAMCLASRNPRWLVEFAEWVSPIYRRRGTSLLDLAALCDGVKTAAAPHLSAEELAAAAAAIDAANAILRRNSRLGGDRHKRNALWNWMYRGV
jgi:hypothetical protein